MKIRTSPTRMQLLILKRRIHLAEKGHKLLKDKLDGLMQSFFRLKSEYQSFYEKIEPLLANIFKKITFGHSLSNEEILKMIPISSPVEINISSSTIMGVRSDEYTVANKIDLPDFNQFGISIELAEGLEEFLKIMPSLIEVAGKGKALQAMALQIIETRRRVNALEYVLIPELKSAAKMIKLKLSELELASQVSMLKVKELVNK